MKTSTEKKVKQLSEEELDKVSGGMGLAEQDKDETVQKPGGKGKKDSTGSTKPPFDRKPHVL